MEGKQGRESRKELGDEEEMKFKKGEIKGKEVESEEEWE